MQTLEIQLRHALFPTSRETLPPKTLALLIAFCTAFSGAILGSFAFLNGNSPLFIAFSALKVPLFLGIAGAICFPGLRVLYTLAGLSDDFLLVTRGLLHSQAAFAAILASLSPFTLVFYLSGATYRGALSFNLALFAVAALCSAQIAKNQLLPLLQSDPRHQKLAFCALALWVFVAVQLAWNLRPFLGSPDSPVEFLRPDAFTNAYQNLLVRLLS